VAVGKISTDATHRAVRPSAIAELLVALEMASLRETGTVPIVSGYRRTFVAYFVE